MATYGMNCDKGQHTKKDRRCNDGHAVRNACDGETELARKAGATVAISADNPSVSAAVAMNLGSYG